MTTRADTPHPHEPVFMQWRCGDGHWHAIVVRYGAVRPELKFLTHRLEPEVLPMAEAALA